MRFSHLLLLFSLLLCCESGFGQKKDTTAHSPIAEDAKVPPSSLNLARFQINDLKKRGIIVRLKTNKDRIAAYRNSGNSKVADKLETKSNATNLLLMYAFVTRWTYSPVYFMESQHTLKLMQKDTLIAKTYDLLRDTCIYMNHDSFYIVDYGDLMGSEIDGNHPLQAAHQSNTPMQGVFIVVKDHNQEQLQSPMPYEAKVWLEEFTNTDKIDLINLPQTMTDSVSSLIKTGTDVTQLIKSEGKAILSQYLDSVYWHITTESKKSNDVFVTPNKNISESAYAPSGVGGIASIILQTGNPFQRSVSRLNNSFIAYYCKRLDKDRNIIYTDEIRYWWQRNPNIPYLLYLRQLETRLKESLDKKPSLTK